MEKINIGEYVRTKDGVIGKVIKALSNRVFLDNLGYAVLIKDILKHSEIISEVMEAGDLCYYKARNSDTIHKNFAIVNHLGKMQLYFYRLEQIEIIKILTHEQIDLNLYKVGGE